MLPKSRRANQLYNTVVLTARGVSSVCAARPAAGSTARTRAAFCMAHGDAAPAEPISMLPAREQAINEQKKQATTIFPLPRRARTQQLAQDQAQVEGSHVDQLPLQNVLVSAQMGASHTTCLVAVGKAA